MRNEIIVIYDMCRDFGMSPTEYLFPGLSCPHSRLAIDRSFKMIYLEFENEIRQQEEQKFNRPTEDIFSR